MKKLIKIVLWLALVWMIAAIILAFTLAHKVYAMSIPVIPEVPPKVVLTPQGAIRLYSELYGSDYGELEKVMKCESGGNIDAVGDNGLAYGIFQFHKPTFDMFSKQMGQELNYKSWNDQAKVAAWSFANGKKSHWTCSKKTGIIN